MIIENCQSKRKNLIMAEIDHNKSSDIVTHEWIIKIRNTLKISTLLITFLKYNVERRHTNLGLIHEIGRLKTN